MIYKRFAYLLFLAALLGCTYSVIAQTFYVSPYGSDAGNGSASQPFLTLEKAREQIRVNKEKSSNAITVILKDGTYYLDKTFVLSAEDGGSRQQPILYKAEHEGKAIISGASPLQNLKWKKYKNGIYQAKIEKEFLANNTFDQLWMNDSKLAMARYPNVDTTAHIFDGVTTIETLNNRAKNYKNPMTGFVHAVHKHEWGSVHYKVDGFKNNELQLTGAWQQNRDRSYRANSVLIENIFEELDAPGEWYLDKVNGVLYLYPPEQTDINKSRYYSVNLTNLIEFKGTPEKPVQYVQFDGLELRESARIFMNNYEPLLRGDWSINRTGAVFMQGTENCKITNCYFNRLGGNGVFMSGYNKYSQVSGSYFDRLDESAVCFVGDYSATRSNPTSYDVSIPYKDVDMYPGPKNNNYPGFCSMDDCLVFAIGRLGKQTAGAFISMSQCITISHNTMYHIPRSGITINDGSWGGHVIENNHIFNSVIETGDHGPFNSWGRDRYWQTRYHGADKGDETGAIEQSKLDNQLQTIIRNNRFEHGEGFSWGIDLDDGTSNYHVYNNLLLGCSFKLREGFYRLVENNISIGINPQGKHVCFKNNQDIIRHNIHVTTDPSRVVFRGIFAKPDEAKEIDYNLYYATYGAPVIRNDNPYSKKFKKDMTFVEWQDAGMDVHSLTGNPMFVDPLHYDFRVKEGSPALKLGFKNFSMNDFGVQKPAFKAIVERDYIKYSSFNPSIVNALHTTDVQITKQDQEYYVFGATIEDLNTEDEKSVAGVGELKGVFVKKVEAGSVAFKAGIKSSDAILSVNNRPTNTAMDFLQLIKENLGKTVELHIIGANDRKIQVAVPIKL